ncbi:MAG: filamentous hemagglutinin N-terminal domain-containing protein [Parahaliea sp.]
MLRKLNTRSPGVLLAMLLAGNMLLPPGLYGAVVFDGTIGPHAAGTHRSGSFEVGQGDGAVAGSNLFQSFAAFGVAPGEFATFSHSTPNIEHIIARVTGVLPSEIHGGMQVRQSAGGVLSPTAASLWLVNPNGIVIGDGAYFDPQSAFVLSTANRVGFANGDDFYSHEPQVSSVLSIADPASFGFLDKQDLPAAVVPAGIHLGISDVGNRNTPLFLSNMTLVGTSMKPEQAGLLLAGDIAGAIAPGNPQVLGNSSQIQALNLGLVALAPGGVVTLDSASGNAVRASTGTALAGVLIDNSAIAVSDSGVVPAAGLSVLSDQLLIRNSYIQTFPVRSANAVSIRALSGASLMNSVLQTTTSTAVDAGDIRIDTPHYVQTGGQVSSRAIYQGGALGDAGNIIFGSSASLPMLDFSLRQGSIQSIGSGPGSAGDVVLRVAGALALAGSAENGVFITSVASGQSRAGNILLSAGHIAAQYSDIFSAGFHADEAPLVVLEAGQGGMTLAESLLVGSTSAPGAGASIGLFSAGDIALVSRQVNSVISTGTSGNAPGGDIVIAASGDLTIDGLWDINSNSLGAADASGSGGSLSLSGRRVELLSREAADRGVSISSLTASAGDGAAIALTASEELNISGAHSISSSTVGPGRAGAVLLQAPVISVGAATAPLILSSSSVAAGDAGRVEIQGGDRRTLSGVQVYSIAAGEGAAGVIRASAAVVDIQDSAIATSTAANDSGDAAAQIALSAGDTLRLDNSSIQSNTAGLAPAGQVQLRAENGLTLQDVSVQSGSRSDGAGGSILVSSGGYLELFGGNTELLTNTLGASDAGDVSLVAGDILRFDGGGIVQTSAVGAGNAGTILLSADRVRLARARIESTSENAGGGDINVFGRDIHLDGDIDAGGIVFISTDSYSSDAAGNGGSITLGDPRSPAELVLVRNSGLAASANAGNGGLITINSEFFLRDARSVFQVTSTLGEVGSLEINSPEQDISAAVVELDVSILDATRLIQDRCAVNAGDGSSLVISGHSVMAESYEGYLASPFVSRRAEGAGLELSPGSDGSLGVVAALAENAGARTGCNYFLR